MRYLFDNRIRVASRDSYDVLIIGSGLAGLYTALHIDERLRCAVVTKEGWEDSSSWLAQGGIAAAIAVDDTPANHFEDTLAAGAGLCDEEAVRVLVDEGPGNINELVERGVPFDLNEDGDLQITLEGGHRHSRVVHAGGDATGRETVKALLRIALEKPNIDFITGCFLVDVITGDGSVRGALLRRSHDGSYILVTTNNVVICTGGTGQVYLNSTNPVVSTGDGIAAAERAGAELKNMEFIQFHPTGLYLEGHTGRTFLISEAVRGEGGLLINSRGERFMVGKHPMAELAPRDIVARGIIRELQSTGETHAFIDITSQSEEHLRRRFPTIFAECEKHGINMSRQPIPVCPVHHFMIGGIGTDLYARTNVPGLFACGEAANTGVHGANRLASNSLLECLVFGRRAAIEINNETIGRKMPEPVSLPKTKRRPARGSPDLAELRLTIQRTMSENGYVIRTEAGLLKALGTIESILAELDSVFVDKREYYEVYNIASVAKNILTAAIARRVSVGAHYREDTDEQFRA
ncbi:MAG: L-aspartate oxidase [Oscillospiraceae bacterium]|jgi:L-aspartate oxidase